MRVCPACQEAKDDSEFPMRKRKPYGYCRPCASIKSKEWREKNPDKVRQSKKVDRTNPDLVKSRSNPVKSEKEVDRAIIPWNHW